MNPSLRTAIGIVVLLALLCLWALVIDYRCSKNLSGLDPTNEEMGEAGRGR